MLIYGERGSFLIHSWCVALPADIRASPPEDPLPHNNGHVESKQAVCEP